MRAAAKISVYVVRAFVKLRELLSTHRELAVKLSELEGKLQNHDQQIIALINAIRSLMAEPSPKSKPPIGYQTESTGAVASPRQRCTSMAPMRC